MSEVKVAGGSKGLRKSTLTKKLDVLMLLWIVLSGKFT